jgi:hypothetical protein
MIQTCRDSTKSRSFGFPTAGGWCSSGGDSSQLAEPWIAEV